MKQIGRKTKEWFKARRKLVGKLRKNDEYIVVGKSVFGICPDCGHHHQLTADHLIKRSQGGGHTEENIEWVCNAYPCFCHDKRDNQGDPMKKKPESKKSEWSKEHICKNCKKMTSFLLCHHCHKLSA